MADLEIDVPTLKGKSSELSTLKGKATSTYDKCIGSYLCTVGDPISGLKEIVKAPMERFKNGYEQSDTWFSNYLTDLESVESGLEAFKGTNVTAPTSFSGKFEDIFGKVTMPVLQTNGDQLANYKTFNSTSEESTEASTDTTSTAGQVTGNTNKDKVFNYLSSQGFNNAAICGIMSNIQYESNFNPTSLGDKGTSYGICQWHNGRWTNLKNYCQKNNLNSSSLEGQLSYLVHELKNSYPSVYNKLKNVPNTKQGAYDASYYWTVHYEVPKNKYQQGAKRGKSAQSTYWDTYGSV